MTILVHHYEFVNDIQLTLFSSYGNILKYKFKKNDSNIRIIE